MSLQYSISHRNHIAVVSLMGELTLPNLGTLDECREKLELLPIRHLVLNMTEIHKIAHESLRPFILIQAMARKANLVVRICGLRSELVQFLLNHGAIRKDELRADLMEGLKSLEIKSAA